jgi:hypothetical protein
MRQCSTYIDIIRSSWLTMPLHCGRSLAGTFAATAADGENGINYNGHISNHRPLRHCMQMPQ